MVKNVAVKFFTMFLVLLMLTVPVYAFRSLGYDGTQNALGVEEDVSNQKRELRAIWVATVYGLDYPLAGATTESGVLKKEIVEMLDNIQGMGFNTVFFQVRPAADALYPSKIFPWSKYLTGNQMTSPDKNFDPLEFIIAEAHKRNIEIHPWINPYRITMKSSGLDELAYDHPAILHPEWVVASGSGDKIRHYFNPGIPEVEQMILDGVSEIVENYDIDGIHLDDYFYPGKVFNDADTYAQYGGEYDNIGDWRRSNIDNLIKKMYNVVKEKDENLQFGVSPFAIWANSSSNPLGSDTKGKESYYNMYADTRGWVKAGYLDYIMPQIYWNIGYEVADYEKILNWWSDVVADTDVDLYIGQAAYRAGNTDPNSPWYGVDQLRAQVNLNRVTDNVGGYAMFRYGTLVRKPELVGFMQEINR
ncbi:glycoside hydrolase family 10 protein [Wukongibacter sp. M2B1]|uniref:glycoside hydrolase family 10 protein n=1 Tax=Wukongibacter sp. M2B1 TaxID=3088895 RepID=UPI003D7AC77A